MEKARFFEFMRAVPKAEIHIHIEAVVSMRTVHTLYKKKYGKRLSGEREKELFSYTDLDGFVRAFLAVQDLFMSVDDFSLVFDDMSAYMRKNGITYCEAFFAPSAFIKKGFEYKEMVSLFEKRINELQEKTGSIVRLLMDVSRTFGCENAMRNYEMLLKWPSPVVIGIGLGGSEAKGPAAEFSAVFERAHRDGFHAVAHAGEDVGPKNVWDSIQLLHAERIGHGISSVQDPHLIDYLSQSKVPFEVCVTSNVFTGRYVTDVKKHPIRELFDDGVFVTVNTDDPVFFRTSLLDEYWICHHKIGFSMDEVKQLIYNSFNAAFLSEEEKLKAVQRVKEEWGRQMAKDVSALQNGSDVRGVACEGVEGENVNLTSDAAFRIAYAFSLWLAKKTKRDVKSLSIGVGRDARITGEALAKAAIRGIKHSGSRVVDCMLSTTPAMFMSTVFEETNYDGSVMITASHLPFNRNGMKFFDRDGGLEHTDIEEILKTASSIKDEGESGGEEGDVESASLMTLYARHLRGKILSALSSTEKDMPLSGLHIIVDAGNGDAGFFVKDVLCPLGADTTGSQFLIPDGMFPNHIPNPENKDAMASIVKATIDSRADLGLIFDTDVDRMSCVLSDGTAVARDAIIALAAAIVSTECPGGTIVTDSVTSDRLTQFIENTLKMHHLRYMRGYKNVIDKCKELNEAGTLSPLAMETSGHGALKENYYLDDGAYLAVKMIIALCLARKEGKTLSSLIASLPAPGEEGEWRFKIKANNFKAYGKKVLSEVEKRAKKAHYDMPLSHEGVRISFHNKASEAEGAEGWMLLRMSLHDPVMPLNIEGMKAGDREKIAKVAKSLVSGFDLLDTSAIV